MEMNWILSVVNDALKEARKELTAE